MKLTVDAIDEESLARPTILRQTRRAKPGKTRASDRIAASVLLYLPLRLQCLVSYRTRGRAGASTRRAAQRPLPLPGVFVTLVRYSSMMSQPPAPHKNYYGSFLSAVPHQTLPYYKDPSAANGMTMPSSFDSFKTITSTLLTLTLRVSSSPAPLHLDPAGVVLLKLRAELEKENAEYAEYDEASRAELNDARTAELERAKGALDDVRRKHVEVVEDALAWVEKDAGGGDSREWHVEPRKRW